MKKILTICLTFLAYFPAVYAQDSFVCQNPVIKVAGQRQVVFNYKQDHCNPTDTFDTPVMAFKDANGMVHLFSGIAGSYMSTGTSLNTVKHDCSQPFSQFETSTTAANTFDNWKWFRSPWTNDGITIYSLVHNEFHGWDVDPSKNCPSQNQNACLFPSVTVAKSTDGGKTFNIVRDANGNVELGMVTPYAYTPDGGSLNKQLGVRAPTNIISRTESDGKKYYFVLANNRGGFAQKGGTCLYRNDDVSNPSGWRAWDGTGFNVVVNATALRNPNIDPAQHICTPVFKEDPTSWTYNTVLNKYIAVININDDVSGEGFGYIASDDMIHWSKPQLIMRTTMKAYQMSKRGDNISGQTYPSILDPQSPGLNFEYSGSNPYLYFTRFNPKVGNWHNRDLLRVPLKVACN